MVNNIEINHIHVGKHVQKRHRNVKRKDTITTHTANNVKDFI